MILSPPPPSRTSSDSLFILLTGGAGFIGSAYAHFLEKQGIPYVISDSFSSPSQWKNLLGLSPKDIVLPSSIPAVFEIHSFSHVVHLGAISSTTATELPLLLRENFQLSQTLWHLCCQYSLPFLYASSAATYGSGEHGFWDHQDKEYLQQLRPLNAYGWSKHLFDLWAVDQATQGAHPPQWGGLKFFNVYGPRETHKGSQRSVMHQFLGQALNTGSVSLFKSYREDYPHGGQKRDFIFVNDCCEKLHWFLENPHFSGLFNIGTGTAHSFLDIVDTMEKALDQSLKQEFIEMPDSIRTHYQYFTQAQSARSLPHFPGSMSLQEGVSQYVQFLKEFPEFL